MSAAALVSPQFYFTDDDGNPLADGRVWTYIATTTTPTATWQNEALSSLNANPIQLDAAGKCTVWVDSAILYKFAVYSADGDLITTIDNIKPAEPANLRALLAASSGSSLVGFIQEGTGASARTAQSKMREIVSVKDFGAVGDGVANDRLAIKATVDYLQSIGGGTVLFPDAGSYLISGTQEVVAIPEVQSNLSIGDTNYDAQLYWEDLENITFEFAGSTLVSDKTGGGITICLDGARRITFDGLSMEGANAMSGSTVVTTGTNSVCLLSRTRASEQIQFIEPKTKNHYTSIACMGDPAASTRVSGVSITGTARFEDGVYGLALQNNGDNVTFDNIYSLRQNRPLFLYGIDNVQGSILADNINGGFQSLIKAYSRTTTNISIRHQVRNRANTQPRLGFQSQHNPALQATPATVENVYVYYDEDASDVGGGAIQFSYYRDAVSQAGALGNKLFDAFIIEGRSVGDVDTAVTLSNANPCVVSLTHMRAANGAALLNATGFVGSKRLTYSPALSFGGASVGMTYTLQSGEYYIQDGICQVVGKITLSAKGSSTGAASLTLPIASRYESSLNPLMQVLGYAMSGLTGAITAFAPSGTSSVSLVSQGAASAASLTDAHFTNTSTLIFHMSYPV